MYLIIDNPNQEVTIKSTIQIFFKVSKVVTVNEVVGKICLKSCVHDNIAKAVLYVDGNEMLVETYEDSNIDYARKRCMFVLLSKYTKQEPKWGMFVGIRPAKKVSELIEDGMNYDEIEKYLSERYFIHKDKILLAYNVAVSENNIIKDNKQDEYSLYVGIPFCPTRCSYCSFTSFQSSKYIKSGMMEQYIDMLIKELEYVREFDKNNKLVTVYIGGGTPTSISNELLEKLLSEINKFDMNNIKEFTVEAGRVDTLDREKLETILNNNVDRISINAQTMNNETLKHINRNHTKEQFVDMFKLAREVGHSNINVDVIVGLPNETVVDITNTMNEIIKLNPENITIHTLTIKNGATIKVSNEYEQLLQSRQVEEMLESAKSLCEENGYKPYYMYRQKNMIGEQGTENIGYTKVNKPCLYNVQIMEEKQTIISCGAGAVTKVVDIASNKIERVFNLKGVEEYIVRHDEIIERKRVGLGL